MKQKIFIGILGVAATAAIILTLSYSMAAPKVTPPVFPAAIAPQAKQAPVVVVTTDSYTLGDRTAFYTKKDEDFRHGVSVYTSVAGNRTEIISSFPVDIPGGGLPEFKKTSDPSIAELTISSGDGGGFFTRSAFIDLRTQRFIQVSASNRPELEITDSKGRVSKIEVSIKDSCGTGESRGYGMDVILEGLLLNGKLQAGLLLNRPLRCTGPVEIGPAYAVGAFVVTNVSSDLEKVYFSLGTHDWKDDFLFDVESGTISSLGQAAR